VQLQRGDEPIAERQIWVLTGWRGSWPE
jgi:hypothetical protein